MYLLIVNETSCNNTYGDLKLSRIKDLRLARGFTQINVQMKTGIDQSQYSRIERGTENMSLESCRKLAIALKTSMDYLVGLTDDPEPYPRSVSFKTVASDDQP